VKALFYTLLLITLSSCSTGRVFESENGRLIPSSSSRIDQLRGANEARDEESMSFSRNIILSAGQPYTDEYGTDYTGVVRVYKWKSGKKVKFVALREIREKNGGLAYQGPNPPTRYYGSDLEEIMIYSLSPEVQEMLVREGLL